MYKLKAKTYPVAVMLALVGFLATGRATAQEAGEIKQTNRQGKGQVKSSGLIPLSFLPANGRAMLSDTAQFQDMGQSREIVPIQFIVQKEVSVEEQRIQHARQTSETLYRRQLEPGYFEKTREAFQKEFHRRMAEKKLTESDPD